MTATTPIDIWYGKMAAALRVAKSSVFVKSVRNVLAVRNYWNYDWKPGPYPKTAEESAAAAKKYGMLPEDYEPYPDDGFGYGDYPKFPPVGGFARSFHENLDMEALKRNYGEPVHANFEWFIEERLNPNAREKYSGTVKALCLFGTLLGILAAICIGDCFIVQKPMLPKQYPKDGVTHYTFEPVD